VPEKGTTGVLRGRGPSPPENYREKARKTAKDRENETMNTSKQGGLFFEVVCGLPVKIWPLVVVRLAQTIWRRGETPRPVADETSAHDHFGFFEFHWGKRNGTGMTSVDIPIFDFKIFFAMDAPKIFDFEDLLPVPLVRVTGRWIVVGSI
jgi:hypothetical protein